MTSIARGSPAGLTPKRLPPSLKHGLRALAVAGDDFEPFVEWIVSSDVIDELVAMGFAQQGESNRPSVGPVGYRLTDSGRNCVENLWYSVRPGRIALVP